MKGASGKVAVQSSGDRKEKKAVLIKANPGKYLCTGYDFALVDRNKPKTTMPYKF